MNGHQHTVEAVCRGFGLSSQWVHGVTAQDVAAAYNEPWAVALRSRYVTPADTYTIEILTTEENPYASFAIDAAISEAEENITDLLPEGYRARIRHWTEAP